MDETLQKQIEERMAALPEEIREAILKNDLGVHVREIATSRGIHVDQMATLEDETILAILGFTDPKDFSNHIQNQVHVDRTLADALATDINTEIFLPIRESMKNAPRAATAPVPVKITTPAAPPPTPPAPPKAPQSIPKAIEPHPADLMLAQKTVSVAPTTPPTSPEASKGTAKPPAPPPVAPKPYTADPYREPAE